MRRDLIVCECGAKLPRPMPRVCPQCQRRIVGVRRAVWPMVWPWFLIVILFGLMVWFAQWLIGNGI